MLEIDLKRINTLRMLAVDAVQKANSGHPGLPMGAAPMAYVLWTRFLKHNPADPHWPNRDRFILSAGHGSMLLYALLYLTGYDVSMEELKQFRQWNSKTPGHPEYGLTPGVETTTGPLGQGFTNGVGMALAARHFEQTFNTTEHAVIDHWVYAIVSDGDLMEGITSEAASLAGHLKLGNLIYLYDNNSISIEGETELAFTEDVGARFEAYGWQVLRVDDGNDLDAIDAAIRFAQAEPERPSLIMVTTQIGYGSPNKAGTAGVHGAPLGVDEVAATKEALGWPQAPDFHVPDDVLSFYREAQARGREAQAAWQQTLDAWKQANPDKATVWKQVVAGELGDEWEQHLPVFTDAKAATRNASGKVMNAIAAYVPGMIGGSADLEPSTKTSLKEYEAIKPGNYAGRNIHFGVREHAMGGIANGMAVYAKLIPYTATFLVFSDYMRPAIRLAALSEFPTVFVFSHDSIGLGEDGPTHQPIEHIMSLRLIPHLDVIRPADANETAGAWRCAIRNRERPTVLLFTRQNVPVLQGDANAIWDGVERGAYVLSDAEGGDPAVILIGTGSEVHLAVDAQKLLAEKGVRARVVSMPSWERFARQPQDYRDSVLPPDITARVAVEAGVTPGWEKWVGQQGAVIGVDRFGASAPYQTIYEELGLTPAAIAERALALVERV